MGARRTDRLWLLGGMLLIIMLVVASYLLAIRPVYDDDSFKQGQVADADIQLVGLKRKLADLKSKSNNMAAYTAELQAKRKALPQSYDVPDFLRQLQDSGNAVGVEVSGISVGSPVEVTGSAGVVAVPITLLATGSPTGLSRFLERLQNVQTRAVLIGSVNLEAGDDSGKTTANVMLTAFCGAGPTCTAAAK